MRKLFLLLVFSLVFLTGSFTSSQKQYLHQTNIIQNAGFENDKAKWTVSGSASLTTTSTALKDSTSAIVDFSATSETLTSNPVSIPEGLKGQNCLVSFDYKWSAGTTGNIKFTVKDGSANAQFEQVSLVQTGIKSPAQASFICPNSSTTLVIELEAQANAEAITLDNFWLGSDYRKGATVPKTSWIEYTPAGAPTGLTGTIEKAFYKRDGNLLSIRLRMIMTGAAVGTFAWALVDYMPFSNLTIDADKMINGGVSYSQPIGTWSATNDDALSTANEYSGVAVIRGETSNNWKLSAVTSENDSVDATEPFTWAADDRLYIEWHGIAITEWSQPDTTVTLDTQGMIYSAYHDALCNWSVSSDGSHVLDYGDATCTFHERVNNNFGVVTSLADGTGLQSGIEFTPKRIGTYFVCASAPAQNPTDSQSCTLSLHFNDVEIVDGQTEGNQASTIPLCTAFNINTLATSTLKVKQMTSSSANVCTLSGHDANNISSINWTIFPISQQVPQAVAIAKVNESGCPNGENICSGEYTMSFSDCVLMDSTPSDVTASFIRVGDKVQVAAKLEFNPSTASGVHYCHFNLPFDSDFTDAEDCVGVGTGSEDPNVAVPMRVSGNSTLGDPVNKCNIRYAGSDSAVRTVGMNFMYKIK